MTDAKQKWEEEVESEIAYWRTLIEREGKAFGKRFHRKEAIPLYLPDLVKFLPSPEITIADIGCGPIPIVIGNNYPKPTRIVGCDPLSARYVEIMTSHGIKPSVELHTAPGERLLDVIVPESVDVAHIRNALDHSFDPLHIIENMMKIVKPGGLVVVQNIVNEGLRQNYAGLHQWNILPGASDFWISDQQGKRHSARDRLQDDVQSLTIGMHQDASRADMIWMDVVIIKRGAAPQTQSAIEAAFWDAQITSLERAAHAIRADERKKVQRAEATSPKPEPITAPSPSKRFFGWFAKKLA